MSLTQVSHPQDVPPRLFIDFFFPKICSLGDLCASHTRLVYSVPLLCLRLELKLTGPRHTAHLSLPWCRGCFCGPGQCQTQGTLPSAHDSEAVAGQVALGGWSGPLPEPGTLGPQQEGVVCGQRPQEGRWGRWARSQPCSPDNAKQAVPGTAAPR